MAQQNPLDMIIGVADRVRMSLEGMLGSLPSTDALAVTSRQIAGKAPVAPAVKVARDALEPFLVAVARVRQALPDLAAAVVVVATDNTLVPAARQSKVGEVVAAARPTIEADMATITTTAKTLSDRIRSLALPQRPAGDSAQDATLDRRERAMRMVCDALPLADVTPRLLEFLRQAIGQGDALMVWHLAGSDWPALYLESRGQDRRVAQLFGIQASEVLGENMASDDAKVAREILTVLDADYGIANLAVACRQWVSMYLDDIGRSTPSAAPFLAGMVL